MKKKIIIEGMSCEHCVKRVENALKALEGIKSAKVNLKKKTATVELSDALPDEALKSAVEEAGYEVVEIA